MLLPQGVLFIPIESAMLIHFSRRRQKCRETILSASVWKTNDLNCVMSSLLSQEFRMRCVGSCDEKKQWSKKSAMVFTPFSRSPHWMSLAPRFLWRVPMRGCRGTQRRMCAWRQWVAGSLSLGRVSSPICVGPYGWMTPRFVSHTRLVCTGSGSWQSVGWKTNRNKY